MYIPPEERPRVSIRLHRELWGARARVRRAVSVRRTVVLVVLVAGREHRERLLASDARVVRALGRLDRFAGLLG